MLMPNYYRFICFFLLATACHLSLLLIGKKEFKNIIFIQKEKEVPLPFTQASLPKEKPISTLSVSLTLAPGSFIHLSTPSKKEALQPDEHRTSAEEMAYWDRWETYVEQFGNKHYPMEAFKNNICGSLELLVTIHPDGSLEKIHLQKSSGIKLLDDAAIQIVQQAAPFEPLPPLATKAQKETLDILRTWQFRGSAYT